MPGPKLRQVAEEANVSLATASMVLAGKGKISIAVRERVMEAARRLGYRRRDRAPRPGSATLKTITILLYLDEEWSHVFHLIRPILVAIEGALAREGYCAVALPTFRDSEPETLTARVLAHRSRGVFSIHYGNESLFRRLEAMGIPVVLVMNGGFQDRFYSVCVDDFQGAYEGALHLIRLGHRAIGYVDYERPDLPAAVVDRFIGFKKALDEYDIPFDPARRLTVRRDDAEALSAGLKALFAAPDRPTALFVHDDHFAARVTAVLARSHLRVPDDVSIIAPGDVLDYREPFEPQITTMRINTALMGEVSANLMINRLKHEPEDIHVLKVKQQLVERGSCRRLEEGIAEVRSPLSAKAAVHARGGEYQATGRKS